MTGLKPQCASQQWADNTFQITLVDFDECVCCQSLCINFNSVLERCFMSFCVVCKSSECFYYLLNESGIHVQSARSLNWRTPSG